LRRSFGTVGKDFRAVGGTESRRHLKSRSARNSSSFAEKGRKEDESISDVLGSSRDSSEPGKREKLTGLRIVGRLDLGISRGRLRTERNSHRLPIFILESHRRRSCRYSSGWSIKGSCRRELGKKRKSANPSSILFSSRQDSPDLVSDEILGFSPGIDAEGLSKGPPSEEEEERKERDLGKGLNREETRDDRTHPS